MTVRLLEPATRIPRFTIGASAQSSLVRGRGGSGFFYDSVFWGDDRDCFMVRKSETHMKLSIVMPVFNERATVRQIVERSRGTPFKKLFWVPMTGGLWRIDWQRTKRGA